MADIGTTSRGRDSSSLAERGSSAIAVLKPPLRRCGRGFRHTHRHDLGATFIELLVAVVLMGLGVIAVLTAMRTTVIATTIEREHSKAQEWLQSAVNVVEEEPFGDCVVGNLVVSAESARVQYETAVRSQTTTPFGWNGGQIRVLTPEVWSGSARSWVAWTDQTACFDDNQFSQQLVTIEVESPDGKIIETIELVKLDN